MGNKGPEVLKGRRSESNEPSALSNPKIEEKNLDERRCAADCGPTSARRNKEEGSLPLPPAKPRPISKQKLAANRRNARRSTGPRTAEGKGRSRGNAWRHGLRSEALLFGSDGMPIDPELQSVYERVRHQPGQIHAETDQLARSVVIEVSHQRRAVQLEENCLKRALDGSSADVSLEHVHRYRTTSRRKLLKQLARLQGLHLGTRTRHFVG